MNGESRERVKMSIEVKRSGGENVGSGEKTEYMCV